MTDAAVADSGLYERDFYAWTQEQAATLRRAVSERVNYPLDWKNVAEEIESLGSEQEHALGSHLRLIIVHLLKLEYERNPEPHRHWRGEIAVHRIDFENRLRRNPSLNPRLPELFDQAYRGARKQIELLFDLRRGALPEQCPYTLEQVRDEDWFAEPREDNENA